MEDFGYQKDDVQSKFSDMTKRTFLVIAALFSLAAFVYITISAYYYFYQDSSNANIETIKSPVGPIKVIEEAAAADGAMQIDHKIYEDIFGNKKRAEKHENTKIKNTPEPALPPKIAEANPVISTPPATITTSTTAKKEQKIIVYSGAATSDKPKDLLTKTDGEKRDNSATPAPKPSNKKLSVRVQVAAMTSKEAAEENWKRLNRLYPNLFSDFKSFIEKVDLGKKGIFYRLQVGNFYNQIEAEEFCNRYVAQSKRSRADCIVVE